MKERKKMKTLKYMNRLVAAVLFCGILAVKPVYGQGGEVVDEIIAKVDDHIILKSELEQAYIGFLSSEQARSYDGDARCLILRSFIENKVLLAMSEIDSVQIDESRVDYELQGRMQRIIQQFGSERAIQEAYGKSVDQFMSELRPGIEEQLLIREQEQNILSSVSVTPAEVRKFYNQIPKDSLPLYGIEYEVGVIVKIPEPSDAEVKRIKDELMKIREQALNGSSFEILATTYSEGPSAGSGGNLGFATRGSFDPAYEAGALGLKPGEISMPIESSFGIHLIQLIERRGNEYNSRHIIMKPKPSEKDLQASIRFLDSLRNEILADSISFEQAAQQYSDDASTSSNGGYISGPYGANRIPAANIDPTLYFAIDAMKEGEISKAATVQADAETTAARIIYFKRRIPPHRANLNQDYEKLKAATTSMKRDQKKLDYLREKMQEVYIEIDPEFNRCKIINN